MRALERGLGEVGSLSRDRTDSSSESEPDEGGVCKGQ